MVGRIGIGEFAYRKLISHSLWAEDFLAVWARFEANRLGIDVPTAGPIS